MLMRIDPFERALSSFRSGFDRAWDLPFFGFERNLPEVYNGGFGSIDISEDEEGLTFKADLPGMDPKDLSVEAKDGVLTIQGKRETEKKEEDKTYHRYERTFGSFCRSFALPSNVNPDKIQAEYKDGVLKVHVPKDEESKPRKIQIEA